MTTCAKCGTKYGFDGVAPGVDPIEDQCPICARELAAESDAVELQEKEESTDLGADQWRERMLFIATELLKSPRNRPMTEEEAPLFCKGALALAEMFVTLDEKLVSGFVPPRAWMKDAPEPGQLPTSDLHRNLKAETEVIVQKMLMLIEQKILPFHKQEAPKLMTMLGKLLSTLALFTSESVRLACVANVKPEAENTNAPKLHLVHDADPKDNN